jgi:hypothetical protein
MVEAFRVGLDEGDKQCCAIQASSNSSGGAVHSQQQIMMQALLSSQVESSESMARFVAVRYAASVFPLNHAPSRCLLLIASGDR